MHLYMCACVGVGVSVCLYMCDVHAQLCVVSTAGYLYLGAERNEEWQTIMYLIVCLEYQQSCLHPCFLPFLTLFSPNSKRPPCLPYLGAYLDQVWSLEMSKSTKNSQGLINFGKMQ